MKYKNYLENKKIAFVGGCPNIKGMKLGKMIDSYDVIVKTNGSVFLHNQLGQSYERDYGSRIDVLYTNNQFYREMRPFPIRMFREKGIKFLRMKTGHETDLSFYNKYFDAHLIKSAISKVDMEIRSAIMGCYIIKDLLMQNPREIHVTGIDFFVSKKKVFQHDNYQEYLDGYLPDKIRNQGNRINAGKKEDGHNLIESTRYIEKLFRESGKITMPDFIKEIMYKFISGEIMQP